MARRIDIELTSKRDDDTWTWRAAGAREPRGAVEGRLLPPTAKVGDTLKVEVEGFLDGLSIVAVVPPKSSRREPERIELLAPRSDSSLVTTQLARRPRREDDRRDRRRRDERGDRGDRRGPRSDRGGRERTERGDRGERRRERPTAPPVDAKPKPKRLRPAKVHRTALLEALPAEQRPIAEQLLQGGIPAVRQAIEKQNETLKADGKTQVSPEPLLEIAEKLRHRAQAAAWRDRADAALASVDDLDLRDLRSVVNAAGDAGRDQEARSVADQLREALANRVEKEQAAWVAEVAENLQESRVVRALRLSSRPPKAGSPLPGNLAEQLITATNQALTSETSPQRWATVLDALAYSPIRRRVVPESLPEKLPADLRELIAKLGSRLPEIAHIFAIEPKDAPSRQRPPRRKPAGKPDGGRKGGTPRAAKSAAGAGAGAPAPQEAPTPGDAAAAGHATANGSPAAEAAADAPVDAADGAATTNGAAEQAEEQAAESADGAEAPVENPAEVPAPAASEDATATDTSEPPPASEDATATDEATDAAGTPSASEDATVADEATDAAEAPSASEDAAATDEATESGEEGDEGRPGDDDDGGQAGAIEATASA